MGQPDNHIDDVDAVLLDMLLSMAENIEAFGFADSKNYLPEARQKLDQYYADFYRTKHTELGAILEALVLSSHDHELGLDDVDRINLTEATQAIDDFYRNKIPTPPRQANELYPQDYVDGYVQAIDDITTQFNSKD